MKRLNTGTYNCIISKDQLRMDSVKHKWEAKEDSKNNGSALHSINNLKGGGSTFNLDNGLASHNKNIN